MDSTRETKRAERRRHQVPSVAIVGYTNAGKSSLLNRLTGAGVLVEDALFATLDPTTRRAQRGRRPGLHPDRHGRLRPPPAARSGRGVRLDPGGVGAGRSAGARGRRRRPDPEGQIRPSATVLADIGAGDVPELIVINKADRAIRRGAGGAPDDVSRRGRRLGARPGPASRAAEPRSSRGCPGPRCEVRALVPYERGDLINRIHQSGEFLTSTHTEDGTLVDRPGERRPGRRAAPSSPTRPDRCLNSAGLVLR